MTAENLYKTTLQPTRGTKLYKNGKNPLSIEFVTQDKSDIGPAVKNTLMIIGKTLAKIGHMGIASKNGYKVRIPPNQHYMVINNGDYELDLYLDQDPAAHEVIYDPYLYENKDLPTVDAKKFKEDNPVPPGYVDTLEKWYSVKFTYEDINYIFIRPQLGISFQTHKMRQEHWEVGKGSPIIVEGSKVHYETKPGDKFDMALGSLHTVINPSKTKWILIKERYSGTFDEEDIERVFNPNNYGN